MRTWRCARGDRHSETSDTADIVNTTRHFDAIIMVDIVLVTAATADGGNHEARSLEVKNSPPWSRDRKTSICNGAESTGTPAASTTGAHTSVRQKMWCMVRH
jgi:hypothetical protein